MNEFLRFDRTHASSLAAQLEAPVAVRRARKAMVIAANRHILAKVIIALILAALVVGYMTHKAEKIHAFQAEHGQLRT